MPKKIIIQLDLIDDVSGDYKKKDKIGKQVRLNRGNYCITETVGIGGVVENTFIFRTGKIDKVKVA